VTVGKADPKPCLVSGGAVLDFSHLLFLSSLRTLARLWGSVGEMTIRGNQADP
jgi:hypothetical protein